MNDYIIRCREYLGSDICESWNDDEIILNAHIRHYKILCTHNVDFTSTYQNSDVYVDVDSVASCNGYDENRDFKGYKYSEWYHDNEETEEQEPCCHKRSGFGINKLIEKYPNEYNFSLDSVKCLCRWHTRID